MSAATQPADAAATSYELWTPRRPALVLCVLSLVLGVLGLMYFEGTGNDGTGRLLEAGAWLREPYNILGTKTYPDGNYLLPALIIALTGELFWGVRIVWMALGVISVLQIHRLTNLLFDRRAAWWAGLAWCLCAYRLTNSLSGGDGELPFLCCLLAALNTIVKPGTVSWRTAIVAGLWITLGGSFRLEAGYWSIVCGVLLLVHAGAESGATDWRRRIALMVLLGLVAALYPALLAYRWWVVFGDPLHYFNYTGINQQQFYATGQNPNWPDTIYIPFAALFYPLSTFAVLTPVVAGLAWVGLFRSVRPLPTRVIACAALVLPLTFALLTYTMHFPLEYRYALTIYALLCVFVFTGWRALMGSVEWLAQRRVAIASLVFATWGLTNLAFGVAGLTDPGIVGRRLGSLTPTQPGAYAAHDLVNWTDGGSATTKIVVSGCIDSPYLALARRDLKTSGRVTYAGIYIDDLLVHTKSSYLAQYEEMLRGADYLVLNARCRGLSLVDGRLDELNDGARASDFVLGSHRMQYVRNFRTLRLYRVMDLQRP